MRIAAATTRHRRLSNPAPLLRWAGSKRKVLPELLANSPRIFNRYIEPFAGSACLFFALSPRRAILGDFNKELIEFYKIVKTKPLDLFNAVSRFPVSRPFYYELRAQEPGVLKPIQAAARFLYLNRFCFNGVYRTNRDGNFNVPFGSKAGPLPTLDQILSVAHVLRNTRLVAGDFFETIAHAKLGDFVYLDPPYSASRYRGEYGYGAFSSTDLERLANAAGHLESVGATFLISYKDCKAVNSRFSEWFRSHVTVRRHVAGFAGARHSVRESLISNRPFREAVI